MVDPSFNAVFDEAIMTRRWHELAEEYQFNFLPLDDEVLAHFERRGIPRGTIAKGRLHGIDADVPALDFTGWVLLARTDLPDEFTYQLTKVLDEQKDAIHEMFGPQSGLTGQITWRKAPASYRCRSTPVPRPTTARRGICRPARRLLTFGGPTRVHSDRASTAPGAVLALSGLWNAILRDDLSSGVEAREQVIRWDEERRAGDGGREVEDAIVLAGRIADEHVAGSCAQ